MNKLKKSLALIAVLAIASTAFVACGGDSSTGGTSTADNSTSDNSTANGGEDAGALTVLAWNADDIGPMITNFTDNTDYTTDQVVYQNVGTKGQEAREQYATYFAGDGDVDLFFMEADWILDYINKDEYTAPLTDLGFAVSDFDGCYKYTLSVGTDNNGVLKGVSWQATPGCYAYRTDLASEYLGVSTPDEMQEYVKDWDTFTETAKKVKDEHDIAMVDSLGGMWQVWQYNRSSGWVVDGALNVDEDYTKKYAELAKDYYDKGYVTTEDQWSDGWYVVTQDDSTLGAFVCTWCFGVNGVLSSMEGNSESTGTSIADATCDGPTGGKYNVCAGPSGWAWGGTWFGLSPKCNNKDIAADFVKYFTIDEESIEKYALFKGEFVNNPNVMKKIVDDKSNTNAYLGGQDQFSILYSAASTIDMGSITAYDSQIKDAFNGAVSEFVKSSDQSVEDMIENFKDKVAEAGLDITVE